MNKIILRNIVVYILLIVFGILMIFERSSWFKEYSYVANIIGILLVAMGSFRLAIYIKFLKDDEIDK